MPKATKRGKRWRCLAYVGKDEHGKRIYKSFTADTKREAERLAAVYEYEQSQTITVYDAIKQYITIKSGVLSPSTEYAYLGYLDNGRYDPIANVRVDQLDQRMLQSWVASLSQKYSAKYVRNVYGLLRASLTVAGIKDIDITLPGARQKEVYVPTDAELGKLLRYLEKPGKEDLRLAVLLAAFGSLRRSEICALKASDFGDDCVTVRRAMVRNSDGTWTVKGTKTAMSHRTVVIPEQVAALVDRSKDWLFDINPDALTSRYRRALRFSEIDTAFCFHSLRHYYVSISHALGIPDAYTMKSGGWKTDYVMKQHYRTTLSDVEQKEQDKLTEHFESLMQPKCNQRGR